uniref:Uncharacterized protein n=1 Tax=Ditylum brightwellii TaxID=49249 RepID=A0A7S4SR69_9STRA|mmetsp:Transcript_13545/g.18184  ORF Transcript_13545/g.18184 Transcript_13545/m.18184 type:complete len:328 (+) Transcript_13545:153-1136(+)
MNITDFGSKNEEEDYASSQAPACSSTSNLSESGDITRLIEQLAIYKADSALAQKMIEYCEMLLKEAHNSRSQADFSEEEVQKCSLQSTSEAANWDQLTQTARREVERWLEKDQSPSGLYVDWPTEEGRVVKRPSTVHEELPTEEKRVVKRPPTVSIKVPFEEDDAKRGFFRFPQQDKTEPWQNMEVPADALFWSNTEIRDSSGNVKKKDNVPSRTSLIKLSSRERISAIISKVSSEVPFEENAKGGMFSYLQQDETEQFTCAEAPPEVPAGYLWSSPEIRDSPGSSKVRNNLPFGRKTLPRATLRLSSYDSKRCLLSGDSKRCLLSG